MTDFIYDLALPPFSADHVAAVIALADEIFGTINGPGFDWRLARLPDQSLALASDASGLVGFKFGHAETPNRYRSWLGGVSGRARRQGVARRLMRLQHSWVQERGYASVETRATADNAAMLELNREFGFDVIGSYNRDGVPRVMLYKVFPGGTTSTARVLTRPSR